MSTCRHPRALAATVVLAVAGCGGATDGADRSSSETTVPVYLVSVVPTTDGDAPGAQTDFCRLNLQISESSSAALDLDTVEPTGVEQWFDDEFPRLFDRLFEAAPTELRADLELVGASIVAFGEALARVDWNPALVFADPTLQEILGNEDLAAAGARLDAYCGLDG